MPSSRCSRAIRSRIWACTVTSSAVVGSSAISSLGSLDERHRDHRALAHAAGELVRVGVDAARRVGDPDQPQQLDRALAGLAFGTSRCAWMASTSCVADLVEGVQRRQRVLEDHRDVVPRIRRRSSLGSVSRSRPSNRAVPAIVRSGPRVRPMTVSIVTLLPEPDSPTMPEHLPGVHVQGDTATACTTPSSVAKSTVRSRSGAAARPCYEYRTRGSRKA